jgi:hypothetical protein
MKQLRSIHKNLKFILKEDTVLSETVKRWVVLARRRCCRKPAISSLQEQLTKSRKAGSAIKQAAGYFCFLNTDNFEHDYQNLLKDNDKNSA